VEAIARQPEAKGSITTTMFIGCGFAETSGVYGLLIAFLLIFVNPLINNNMAYFERAQELLSAALSFLG
jgi:F-type H+-transporting ATPase subunit c